MERIGVRELRQNASVWLRRIEAGETFEVTRHGRPVARLTPITDKPESDALDRLVAEGRAKRGKDDLLQMGRGLAADPSAPSLSEILRRMREHER